jgi:hypothetical protein
MKSNALLALGCLLVFWSIGIPAAAGAPGPRSVPALEKAIFFGRLESGKLIGVFQQEGEKDAGPDIMARYSSDNGANWSRPERLFALPKGYEQWWVNELLVDKNGEIQLFFMIDGTNGKAFAKGEQDRPLVGEMVNMRIDIGYVRSSHHRADWSKPRVLWIGYTGALNSVIQMDNGRILLPFSYLTKRSWGGDHGSGVGAFTFMGQYNCVDLYSDDDGTTWHLSDSLMAPVPDIVSAYGAVEPVVVQLKDGRVWMLMRTQMGRFWESFSRDGAHWSEPGPTDIISSDSPAGLVRLSDGRLVLLWNDSLRYPYAYGGRQILHAAVSDDSGRTWRGYREVGRDPLRNEKPPTDGDFGTGYPYPAVADHNWVIFASGLGKGRALREIMDPAWLYETRQTADFLHRAEEWTTFGTRGVEIVADPDRVDGRALQIRKTQAGWPAAAVWNFPAGAAGKLRLRIKLNPGFAGALIGLTDHFSTPFDLEDRYNNAFNLWIGPDGELSSGKRLEPGRWHTLELAWNADKQACIVTDEGQKIASLPVVRCSRNVCYLRLRSTAETTDAAGFLVDAVSVDVSPGRSESASKNVAGFAGNP